MMTRHCGAVCFLIIVAHAHFREDSGTNLPTSRLSATVDQDGQIVIEHSQQISGAERSSAPSTRASVTRELESSVRHVYVDMGMYHNRAQGWWGSIHACRRTTGAAATAARRAPLWAPPRRAAC